MTTFSFSAKAACTAGRTGTSAMPTSHQSWSVDQLAVLDATVSSNKISLLTVIVNSKNNSKTSNKQQKRKLIEEKCYWNQP
mmetsp:Transcript_102937/g.185771  ORF Transcript_102937/g.185771 Transcript_102937/m.185771 type:complete len:81 (+) Transcript_102937:744-986(+)